MLSSAQPDLREPRVVRARANAHRRSDLFRALVGLVPLLVSTAPPIYAQTDAAKHSIQYVTVDSAVRLEVLDWGGAGRPIVLLPGGNATAHDFDSLAPKLIRDYHVYGITRRGIGASSHPVSGYESDRLGDDVLAVLDSLALRRPVLVGHSRSGAELISIGSRFPGRVSGLVYLDAGYYYAFYDAELGNLELDILDVQRKLQQVRQLRFAKAVSHQQVDSLFGELLDRDLPALARELRENRQSLAALADTTAALPSAPSWGSGTALDKMWQGAQKYSSLRVPVLAIYMELGWLGSSNAADAFQRVFPTARVVRLPRGSEHYVWKTNEAEVLRELRAFIAGLARGS